MISSSRGGIRKSSGPQSKPDGSWITPLPAESVTSRARGSILESGPAVVSSRYRYSCPARASPTSAYQQPSSSGSIGSRPPSQPLKSPTTATRRACGAQTRNAVRSPSEIAPIPAARVPETAIGPPFIAQSNSQAQGCGTIRIPAVARKIERRSFPITVLDRVQFPCPILWPDDC